MWNPPLGVIARRSLSVLVATVVRKWTGVVARCVELRPADDAEAGDARDVGQQAGRLVDIDAELALVSSDCHTEGVSPNAVRSSGSCQMLAGSPFDILPKSSGCSKMHLTMKPQRLAC